MPHSELKCEGEEKRYDIEEIKLEPNFITDEYTDCLQISEQPQEQNVADSNNATQLAKTYNEKTSEVHTEQSSKSLIDKKREKFKCQFCKRFFDSVEQQQLHSRIHADKDLIFCEVCDKSFTSAGAFRRHTISMHTEKKFKCTVADCNREFAERKVWEDHLKMHTVVKRFVCDYCNKSYARQRSLNLHINKTHKIQPFRCIYCQKSFETEHGLALHEIIHTSEAFSCDICHSTYPKFSKLQKHMEVHTEKKFKCMVCNSTFRYKQTLKDHLSVHAGLRPHICEICGNQYPYRASLKMHKLEHDNSREGAVRCIYQNCNKIITRSRYQHHLLEHDPEAKTWQCDQCEKSFTTEAKMKAHITRHSDEKNFPCSVCGMALKTKYNLQKHMNIHTGDNLYTCTTCNKSFRHIAVLNSHKRVHTGEKRYICDIEGCNVAYMYDIDLKRHRFRFHGIYHKKYLCPICSRIFPENKLLQRHLKSHEV